MCVCGVNGRDLLCGTNVESTESVELLYNTRNTGRPQVSASWSARLFECAQTYQHRSGDRSHNLGIGVPAYECVLPPRCRNAVEQRGASLIFVLAKLPTVRAMGSG